ncbi:MAG: hypothetical protein KF760_24355 [Candidatus Eremiobacteraeota bacterium]|nr:hypothetical protein [Candidatus Eremiobacteraeota bacterium]
MNKKVLLALASGAILMSNAAPAENYYVRNRPFTQVVKAGGEAMVSAEAFLRALGLNWTVDGSVVTLTDKPAANPPLKTGVLTYRYGSSEVQLEGSPRGGATFVSLRPLAKLANYSVATNSQLGTVDVNKARMSTEEEKKQVGEVQAQFAAAQKEKEEAWTRKAAELKEKREKEAEEAKKTEEGKESTDSADAKDTKESKGKDKKEKEKKPEETAATQPTPPAEPKPEEKKPEEKKEASLEALPVNVTANSLNGTVTMQCEVRNIGNAPSKGVSGTLTLTGPNRSGSVTDNGNSASSTWYTKSINGPSIAPGASWTFTETWRHPSGNSMPIGNINASIKLNSTK